MLNKKTVENLLKSFFNADNSWRIAILRFFNPLGAHKCGLIGENSNEISSNLMPYILKVAAGELEILNIYGNDYNTPDGTGVRDYIHVVDLAHGHTAALKTLIEKPQFITVNLGTGIGYSVLDVVNSFEKVTNQKINLDILPRREGDIAVSFADPSIAKKILNWEARYNLDEMCFDSWNFKLNH